MIIHECQIRVSANEPQSMSPPHNLVETPQRSLGSSQSLPLAKVTVTQLAVQRLFSSTLLTATVEITRNAVLSSGVISHLTVLCHQCHIKINQGM